MYMHNTCSMYTYNLPGLDVNRDHIMEIACVITDKQLNVVAEVCTVKIECVHSYACLYF